MNKSDYWNEKENEKYLKMKAEIEEQKLDFKKAKKFSEISNKVVKIACVLAIIIGIFALAFSLFYVIIQWKGLADQTNPNIIKNMENMFDEKFEVLFFEENENVEIYKLATKSNNKIICTVYKKGSSTSNDFQAQAFKYFVDNILDEDIKNNLTIEEKFQEINENKNVFLRYNAYFEVETFSQIEKYTELMQKVRKKALNEKNRVFNFITCNSWIKSGNYYSPVSYTELNDAELKREEKDNYEKYIEKNKKTY